MEKFTMININQITELKRGEEFNTHDNEEEFFLCITNQFFNNEEQIIITDFEGNTKIFSMSFVKMYSSDFVDIVLADFNLTIKL
jgi:hypothetical protein